jgi:cytochrome c
MISNNNDNEKGTRMRRRFPIATVVMALGVAFILGSLLLASNALRVPVAPERHLPGADPEAGREAILRYGCGSCHEVRGVREARGRVAPSLTGVAERSYLAGRLPNTPDNMIRWIQNPQAFIPGTAVPNLGVTESDARNIAAYLYGLR